MKTFSVLALLVLFVLQAHGQSSITGTVIDSTDRQPLPRAHIYLYTAGERFIRVTTSDEGGRFDLEKIQPGDYVVRISFVSYTPFERAVTVGTTDVRLGTVTLAPARNLIDEVSVEENIKTATLIGDTIQFNADAFKTMPDASAQDLAEKLPGVVVENNKVQAQGEDVKEVLVDGRSFFGYDPSTALSTLPAEVVEKIQIFDKESDQAEFTGFSTGETTKTMNIITRARMRNGSFGKLTAGYGYVNKYMINGNYNIFDGDRRISIVGQTNNINQQNFAFEDLMGIMAPSGGDRGMPGGGGRGGGRMGGGMAGGSDIRDFMVNQQSGISVTHAGGVNYSDTWGETFEVSGSYFFNLTDNTNEENIYRQYLLSADSGQVYDETATSDSRNINHRFSARMEYTIDENNSILMRPRVTYQSNAGFTAFNGVTSLEEALVNTIENRNESELGALNLSNMLLFRHKFSTQGRTLSLNVNSSWNNTGGEQSLFNTTRYYLPGAFVESIDQYSELRSGGWSVNSNLTYTEPLSEYGLLNLSYRSGYQENHSEKETRNFDLVSETYALFDTLLSNTFNNDYLTQRPGAGINFRKDKLIFNAGVDYQYANLFNKQVFPETFELNKTYHNILFNGMLRYGKSRMNSIVLRYFSSTDLPSLTQLQDVIDNSDPLQLTTGNPNLDNSYIHRIFLRYSNINPDRSRVFFAMLAADLHQDYIGNHTLFARRDTLLENGYLLSEGAQLTSPVNLDGYYGLRSFITYGIPVETLKMNLNFNLSGGWTRVPGMVDNELNYSNQYNGSGGVVLSSNISENIDFTLSSRTAYNRVVNSLSEQQNTSYLSQVTGLRFKWIFFKGFLLESNAHHTWYKGLSDQLDPSYFILNAGLGKKLFRNQLGEIKLSVYDLLNENQSLQRTISDIYIEDSESMVLQRFLMLTFTYNFRNFNGGEMPEPGRFGPPPGMRPGMRPGGGDGTGPGRFVGAGSGMN